MSPRLRDWLISAIVFIVAFDVAFLWQRAAGAHTSEFGAHPDEAAHYVTGLMVRDYLAVGFPGSPMKFADDYYAHYPKIGLGVWPPAFYLVQAAWTLPFGTSRLSLLCLMCALAATVALLIFRALRTEYGHIAAGFGALLFLSLPLVREYDAMVMAEMLSAATMFAATLAFGRYLDSERKADALWFGLLSALAILTKGTGLALALTAPLAILFTGKWRILRRPALWGSVALIALLAGPWTWHFRDAGRLKGGWLQPNPSWSFSMEAIPYYFERLVVALGPVVAGVLLVGIALKSLGTNRAGSSMWAGAGALVISVLVFQGIMPVGLEARHLIPLLPAVLLFAVAAVPDADRFGRERREHKGHAPRAPITSWVLVILVIPVAVRAYLSPERKAHSGFAPIAERLLEENPHTPITALISSDASGEGMFISELAMRDPSRPTHTVRRGTKVLADMQWSGANAKPKFPKDEDLLAHLLASDIGYIVADESMPEHKRGPHIDQLRRLLEAHSARFWPMARSTVTRGGDPDFPPIRAYRIVRSGARP